MFENIKELLAEIISMELFPYPSLENKEGIVLEIFLKIKVSLIICILKNHGDLWKMKMELAIQKTVSLEICVLKNHRDLWKIRLEKKRRSLEEWSLERKQVPL